MYFISRSVFVLAAGVALFWGHEVTAQQTEAPEFGPQLQTPKIQSPAAANAQAKPFPQPQAPFELDAQQQERLEKILTFWEHKSGNIKTYSCQFVRREYDPVFGPKNPNVPFKISEGTLRYAAPDKGEFHIESSKTYRPPAAPGGKPAWNAQAADIGEHWVCDGKSIFELNHKEKKLIESKLPPDLQGQRITDGPLPFMFGAKKEKMLQRYWLREVSPMNNQPGQYWLEATPKTRGDRANFQRVTVILDADRFLPLALLVHPPNHDPKRNPARTSYEFQQRKVDDPIHRGRDFFNQFISPQTPVGWQKVVENLGGPDTPPRPATASNPPPKQARVPQDQPKR